MNARSILAVSDAVKAAMEQLEMAGRYDVRWNGSRSTGYVGEPTGEDYEVEVTVRRLPEQE